MGIHIIYSKLICTFFEEMKDSRFNTVRKLILANQINTFSEILETMPKTTLAKALGINPERFNRLIANIDLFVIKDLVNLAKLLEVDSITVLTLIDNELNATKRGRKGK